MVVPYPVNEVNPVDYEKLSIKEIEKQLDILTRYLIG